MLSLVVSLVVLVILGSVDAAKPLPSYITACKLSDPDLSKCATENANKAIGTLVKGDAEYKTPQLSPMKVPQLEMKSGDNLKIVMKDVTLYGLENSVVDNMKIDPEKHKIEIVVKVPWLNIDSQYTITGMILILPISGNGPANMTFYDSTFNYGLDYDLYKKKDGKDYMRITKTNTDVNIDNAYFRLENLFNGNKELDMIPPKYILFGVSMVIAMGFAFYKHYQERRHSFYSENNTHYGDDDAYPSRERSKKRGRFYKEKNCVVCLEEINHRSKILSCGHIFHISCIESWLNTKSQCPICRKNIDV